MGSIVKRIKKNKGNNDYPYPWKPTNKKKEETKPETVEDISVQEEATSGYVDVVDKE